MRNLPLLICLLLLLSCSQGGQAVDSRTDAAETGKNAPAAPRAASLDREAEPSAGPGGEPGLAITPAKADRRTVLALRADGFDLSSSHVEWVVNGMPFPGGGPRVLPASELAVGDEVVARARTKDKVIESNAVVIENAPPELTEVALVPEVFLPGDRLGVKAAWEDPDDDEVALSYEWTLNGEPAGSGPSLDRPLASGDRFSVTVTPSDGEASGTPVTLHREMGNQPPMISEELDYSFDGASYTFRVRADDPDGDALTFGLVSGPEEMTIDPSSGLVRWDVPPGFVGEASFEVAATDGRGGESTRSLTLTISPEKAEDR